MRAVGCGHLELTKELLRRGAKVNVKDELGRTAVDIAKRGHHAELANMLEEAMQAAGVGAESDSLSKQHLEKMTATVGELPASQTEVHEARRQHEAEEAASRARQLEA